MSDLIGKVDELGELVAKHGLTSIKFKNGDVMIEVRRDLGLAPSLAQTNSHAAVPISHSDPPSKGVEVPSPMVGVFYRKPSPSEPPFVEEGTRIEVGQVIGIIEAMKVFNEVESPFAGIVKKFLVQEGGLVQEGDPLLVLEP